MKEIYEWCQVCANRNEETVFCLACLRRSIKEQGVKIESPCEFVREREENCGQGDHVYPEIKPLDIRRDTVEVIIRHDGQVIWVNTKEGCVCRISGIKELILEDRRTRAEGKITATKPDPSVRATLKKR